MIKLLGSRGAAVVGALFLTLIGGSTEAFGQQAAIAQVTPAVLGVPVIAAPQSLSVTLPNILQPAPVQQQPRVKLSLSQLVAVDSGAEPANEEENCLATAVYFEARGESLEGQLAVARVVLNRAVSGKYPTTWCGVVKQPWQFSFVRNGRWPSIGYGSESWRKAKAIARIAMNNAAESVPTDCLWYHADYVAPSWGRRLTRIEKIGAHIFYRS